MTAHPEIREAAAVAVPDAKYGEVVGVWIVREPHTTRISRDDVRSCVSKVMNPQVRKLFYALQKLSDCLIFSGSIHIFFFFFSNCLLLSS